ncbi:MAG: DUF6817 domain-containing protein [Candidatus Latescibacterota bacterium]|jgi:hypothetical protein
MPASFRELTDFFKEVGAADVSHTNKSYLAHCIGVHNDMKKWDCDEEMCRAGLYHSIYGTELFQDFALPVARRGEVRALIGERAEYLVYVNCAMVRDSFDSLFAQREAPYVIGDRLTGQDIEMTQRDFDDLVLMHLCDWLEQVARWENWDYRRAAFEGMARRLGGIAETRWREIISQAPTQ